MNYSNFARRKGSKDKKKRNATKAAAAVGGGLALAAGARYGLGLLGKKVKAQTLLAGSNPKALAAGKQRVLPSTSSYKPNASAPQRARRTNQNNVGTSNGVMTAQSGTRGLSGSGNPKQLALPAQSSAKRKTIVTPAPNESNRVLVTPAPKAKRGRPKKNK